MSPTDPLVKLFGGPARVKLLRLFLLNPESIIDKDEIARRSRIPSSVLQRELAPLVAMGFVRSTFIFIDGKKGRKTKVAGWRLNPAFKLNEALGELLFETDLFSSDDLIRRFQNVGKVKLIITSGIFLREQDSRVDLLLVVDNLKKNVLERIVRQLEAEIGRELNYSVFSSADFQYRVSMYDKFVRDVLDYPHVTVLDRIGLEPSPVVVC